MSKITRPNEDIQRLLEFAEEHESEFPLTCNSINEVIEYIKKLEAVVGEQHIHFEEKL